MKLATVCRRAAAATLIAAALATSAVPAFAATAERPPVDEAVVTQENDGPEITLYSNHSDTGYHFALASKGKTGATGFRRKDNTTSVYMGVTSLSGQPLRIFVDGALNNDGYMTKDCTQGTYRARKKGHFGLYNMVREYNKNSARLTAWAEKGAGTVSGLWSPDSVGWLEIMGS